MKVFLATAADAPWSRQLRAEVEAVARQDRFRVHELTSDPESADVVLFLDAHHHLPDWRQRALRRHQLIRAFPEKSLVYDERDQPVDALPGVYVAMPARRFDAKRHRAFAYYYLRTDTRALRDLTPDLLFSFRGRRVDRLRDEVLALAHPRGVVEDTSELDFFGPGTNGLAAGRDRYLELVGRSKFVLCPRGAGTSSLRLFEAMAAGRVPVILSNQWVEPAGIDWDTCAVRMPEREVESVPARLEALEEQWSELACNAALVYDEWFRPEVWFHRVIEHCGDVLGAGSIGVRRQWTSPMTWRLGLRRLKAGFPGIRLTAGGASGRSGLARRRRSPRSR
jgi:hypothetical protein